MKNHSKRYPSFPKEKDEKTLDNIIRQYPKTNDCEIESLGELRDWQIKELQDYINKKKENAYLAGYKKRAEMSNLEYDFASELHAKSHYIKYNNGN